MPLIPPLVDDIVRPAGSFGDTVYVTGSVMPLLAVKAVVPAMAWPAVAMSVCVAGAMLAGVEVVDDAEAVTEAEALAVDDPDAEPLAVTLGLADAVSEGTAAVVSVALTEGTGEGDVVSVAATPASGAVAVAVAVSVAAA